MNLDQPSIFPRDSFLFMRSCMNYFPIRVIITSSIYRASVSFPSVPNEYCRRSYRSCSTAYSQERANTRCTQVVWISLRHTVWKHVVVRSLGEASRTNALPPAPYALLHWEALSVIASLMLHSKAWLITLFAGRLLSAMNNVNKISVLMPHLSRQALQI